MGIHDLCWQPGTPEKLKQRLRELEDEEPETRDGWLALFEDAGLMLIEVQDRSDVIPDWIRGTRSQFGVLAAQPQLWSSPYVCGPDTMFTVCGPQ